MRRARSSTWIMTWMVLLTLAYCLSILPHAAAQDESAEQTKEAATFALPRLTTPPTIDGAIGAEEWSGAVTINCPVRNTLYNRDAAWYAGWAEGGLYLACRSLVRENERLIRNQRLPYGNTVFDDSVEIYIDPQGLNLQPGELPNYYQMILNSVDSGWYGIHKPAMGVVDRSWQPRMVVANRLTADGRWWDFEMFLPQGELRFTRPLQAGDRLGLLLARNFKQPWMQTSIPLSPWAKHWSNPGGYPQFVCVEGQPFARLGRSFPLLTGKAHADVEVVNPSPQQKTVRIDMEIAPADRRHRRPVGDAVFTAHQDLTVEAGGRARWLQDQAVPALKPGTLFHCKLAVTETAAMPRALARYSFAFKVEKDPSPKPLPARPDVPQLSATFNPVHNSLLIQIDMIDNRDEAAGAKVRYEVQPTDSGDPLAEGCFDRYRHWRFTDVVALPKLKPGNYTVRTVLLDETGTKRYPQEAAITKLDEAAEFAWWQTKAGDPEKLMPPFTPVGYEPETRTASCWNRTLVLGGLALPERIEANGLPLLAAPITLALTCQGEDVTLQEEAAPTFVSKGRGVDWRADLAGAASGGGIKVSTTTRLEQDGAYFVTLTVAPEAKPVEIEALRLRIPIRADAETMLAFAAAKHVGLVPQEQGRIWVSSQNQPKTMAVGAFVPVIWVGDERNGLFWVSDSDRGWVPSDKHEASELIRTPEALVLQHNLIDEPEGFLLDTPRTLSFWLLPTPARPATPDWRVGGPWHGGSGAFSIPHQDFDAAYRYDPETKTNGWMWYHPPTRNRDLETWEPFFARMRRQPEQGYRKGFSLPSTGYGLNTGFQKERNYFAADWAGNTYTPSLQDHYIWLFDHYVRRGHLNRIYLDCSNLITSANLTNDLGYTLPDGRVQQSWVVTARREFHKRLYAVFVENNRTPAITGNNIGLLPTTAFHCSYLTGDDNINVTDAHDFAAVRPGAFLRSCAIPGIMGSHRPFYVSGHGVKANPWTVRGHLALHNILGSNGEPGEMHFRGIRNLHTRGDLQLFHPYWRNGRYIALEMKGVAEGAVKCSLLQQAGDELYQDDLHLFAFNYDKESAAQGAIGVDLNAVRARPAITVVTIEEPWWGRKEMAKRLQGVTPRIEGRQLRISGLTIPARSHVELHLRLQ